MDVSLWYLGIDQAGRQIQSDNHAASKPDYLEIRAEVIASTAKDGALGDEKSKECLIHSRRGECLIRTCFQETMQ